MEQQQVSENVEQLRQRIQDACKKSNRSAAEIKVIAVTKYVSVETAQNAVAAGIIDLGENRLEGLMEKMEALGTKPAYHFIGALQSRKVKQFPAGISYIHSLDRTSLAKELDKRFKDKEQVNCFVQVNVSGEASKSGIEPDDVFDFIKDLKKYESLHIVGLMTMAPFEDDPEQTRPVFKQLREIRDRVKQENWSHAPCSELSMGMSNDFEVAIEEGATFIRIGTSLVGNEKMSE